MKIAIRADGDCEIGMGHVMRTLVLAKELKNQKNQVFYICRAEELNESRCSKDFKRYKTGVEKIILEGFKVKFVREKHLIEDIRNISADILITDSYDVDEDYFYKTKKLFKYTAYIDDMNLQYFDVDFIINQNITALDFKYKVPNYTKLFLGTRYVMLREEFRSLNLEKPKKKIENIMITVGGGDPYNITSKLIAYLKKLDYNFNIVIGPAFKKDIIKEIEKESNGFNNIILYENPNIIDIMKKSDLAISACGSTLYELSACGIPTLGIVVAENQYEVSKKMHEKGLIYSLGWYNDIKKDKLMKSIDLLENVDLRSFMINRQIEFINVNGVVELAKSISCFCKNTNLDKF